MQRVMLPKERQTEKMVVAWSRWSLRVVSMALLPSDEGPSLEHPFIMNILVWNCRGALKPSFQRNVRELTQCHNPAILVVMETKIGGERAKEITDRLPFDSAIHTETIGYTGGLWMLWNSDRVEITALANTEQEIHTVVKVRNSNSSWLFTAIYASPRTVERHVLWNNLIKVAEMHDMP